MVFSTARTAWNHATTNARAVMKSTSWNSKTLTKKHKIKLSKTNMTQLSGNEMNVYQKLNIARKKFHGIELKKSGHNKFAGYKYFELGDFIIPALDIFNEVGLTGIITFGATEAHMEIVDNENPENRIIISSPMSTAALKGCHEVQNLGAVQTYLRRYLWVAALEIVEHDALDSSPKLTEEGIKKKGAGPVITPRGDIGEDLPQDIKDFLTDLAAGVTELVDQGKAKQALALIDEQALEADQRVWLANQMSSTVRSALKNAKG